MSTYVQSFTDSQRRAFEWVSTAHQNDQQIFAAVVSPTGTGKSYLLNGLIESMWLRGPNSRPVVLPPISLHGGTNVHNFFALDIECNSRLEHGTTQAALVCRTNALVIDEFSMITFYVLHTAEGLTRQRASHGRGPHTAEGLTRQRASHGRGPHTAEGLTRQRVSHGRGPHTAEGLTRQRASHGRGPHMAEGLTQQRASAANLQTLPCLSHTTRSLSPHSCHNAVANPEHVISQAICSFPLTSWLINTLETNWC